MSGKEEKWVFTGKGPEGKRYFRKIKIRKPSPEDPANLQPYEDLPPVEPEPPERPVSPMYPTTKPPREDVPMGGTPRGDRD